MTELLGEREILRNLKSLTYPYARETALAFVEKVRAQRILGLPAMDGVEEGGRSLWALRVKGRLAGTLGFRLGEGVEEGDLQLGYWLGKPYWGKGLATLAVARACAWAWRLPRTRRISAQVFGWNCASCRVLVKNGFQLEGRKRQGIVRFGEVTDLLYYGLLPDDAFQMAPMKA